MFLTEGIRSLGRYMLLVGRTFRRPESGKEYWRAFMRDIDLLGFHSLPIVTVISLFVGAVVTIQTQFNLNDPLVPEYYVAVATRESMILEFSPTIISLILAGKVGSNIASTIGSMRVSEQIDALEVIGVNSASFLILPKVVALMLFNPVLIIVSMFVGIFGGYLTALNGVIAVPDYLLGLQTDFNPFYITYALSKTVIFSFLIATISAYYGYYVKGGAIGVGINATKAVVSSSVAIIVANYVLTELFLNV